MVMERSAGVVLVLRKNDEPQFLLLNYGRRHWGFPKGNIENGETEKEAAKREVSEETGINNIAFCFPNFKEVIRYVYRRAGAMITKEVIYFLAETLENQVVLSYEHQGYQWLPFNQALKRLTFKNDKAVLEQAKAAVDQAHARELT
ncbi:MAG: NUDIX domain-containing protein [Candidatus Bathyarchaeota archaeon]|nr:MAG: NUDIX domain-containing protein [Candidatus Bathyarchaeota archaeon]